MEGQKYRKVVRGFSMVDPEMVSKLHTDIKEKGRVEHDEGSSYGYNFREIAHFNFTLPDFSQFDDGFVAFLMKYLVENSTLKALEESGHLNWWTKGSCLQRLLPLLTSGDGNCLLHAASLGIWGVHDRLLNLRQAMYQTLSSSLAETTLKRRWQWYNWVKTLQEGLVLNAEEWEAEWKSVLNMADAKPRSPQQPLSTVPEVNATENEESSGASSWQPRYESLEEIHICSLAHVLRRPIIVVSDNWFYDIQGNRMSPIPFAGVYLPVECDPSECCRVPLVLAYSSSHFSPVVSCELQNEATPTADSKTSPDHEKASSSSVVQSAILLKPSKNPSSDKASKSSDVPMTSTGTTSSTIQAAVTSIYQMTKSTFLQAAKSLNPSNTPTTSTTEHNQSNLAAIPLVDKELRTLPLPFAVDPGQKWNWLEQDNSEDIIKDKMLTDNERMALLKKYLDVVEINIKSSDQNNEAASSETQENFTKYCTVPVAILPCDNQPSFYKQVITGYLEKAKEDFNLEKETKINEPKQSPSMECVNESCDLYGTVANNYLCTKCFQLQTKSIVKYQGHPPPYAPPSYSEAVGNKDVFYPPSLAPSNSSNTEKTTTTLIEQSIQCRDPECTFYGTSDKMGFCSKCYNKNKK